MFLTRLRQHLQTVSTPAFGENVVHELGEADAAGDVLDRMFSLLSGKSLPSLISTSFSPLASDLFSVETGSEREITADQMSHFSDETVMAVLDIFNTVCAFRVNIYKYKYVYSVFITSLKILGSRDIIYQIYQILIVFIQSKSNVHLL